MSGFPTPEPARLSPVRTAVCLGGLLPAAAAATWWLVGDISEVEGPYADHAWTPPNIGATDAALLGIAGLLIALGCFSLLLIGRPSKADWIRAGVPMVLAGAILGYSYRVFTAGVIGANIGAGMMMMFGGPIALFGLINSISMARAIHRRIRSATAQGHA